GRPRTLPARLAPDGGCRTAAVARRAGGLLPHRFTLTAARGPRRSALCCPFARVPPPCSRHRPPRRRPAFPRRARWLGAAAGPVHRHPRYRPGAPRGQPRVDPEVRETVGLGVPLPRHVLEPDRSEALREPADASVERLEVRRLHPVDTGELVDQQLAV